MPSMTMTGRRCWRCSVRMSRDWWQDRAACRGGGIGRWFADPRSAEAAEAVTFCERCPVRNECLEDALEWEGGASTKDRGGIWGGLTPMERARLHVGRVKAARKAREEKT